MSGILKLPTFSVDDSWGPSDKNDLPFNDLPFVPFTKRDPINYIADFTPSFYYGGQRRNRGQRERTGDDQAVLGNFSDNEDQFQGSMVRTKKYDEKKYGGKDWSAHRNKMAEAHDRLHRRELNRIENAPQSKFRPKQQIMRRKRRKKLYENPRPTTVSIKKSDVWQLMQELWFNSIIETTIKPPNPDDNEIVTLYTAGSLSVIRNDYDAIRCRTPAKLDSRRYSDLKYNHFDYVSASNDPILCSLAHGINKKRSKSNQDPNRGKWKVFTTDTIMALLMCIIRSKYSFDVVITKIGRNIFLDQRSKTNSYWHVDETSQNRPTKKNTANINKHTKLAVEATFINHILSEQLAYHNANNIINLQRKHPFAENIKKDGEQTLASTAFIYKQFDLPGGEFEENQDDQLYENEEKNGGNINGGNNNNSGNEDIRIYCRCSVHGFDKDKSNNKNGGGGGGYTSYVNVYALNQYDNLKSKTADWNKELDQGVAGILLTEIANNAFKMARMAVQSYLVGADNIKLGFVTREKSNIDSQHHIVGVKTFGTRDMLRKCNIQLRHEWGILRHIINMIKRFDDGRYIAVRDPLKQVIRFYRVELNAFGKDDELQSYKDIQKFVDFSQKNKNNNNDNTNSSPDKQNDQ